MFKWKIVRRVRSGEYSYVTTKPLHPNPSMGRYSLEHRIIMENKLQRLLTSKEIVHHKNGNKLDNRVSNLELMTIEEHTKYHAIERSKGVLFLRLKCPNCGKKFEKEKRNTHLIKGGNYTACSRKCSGTLGSMVRQELLSYDQLEGNVIEEFRQ